MYHRYLAEVQFSAVAGDWYISMRHGPHEYFALGAERELWLFVHFDEGESGLKISSGESRVLRTIIFPVQDEDIDAGTIWWARNRYDQRVLGECEAIRILAKWRGEHPEQAKDRHYFRI